MVDTLETRISCDVGGTFTDVVVGEPDGRITMSKALTEPHNLFDGLRTALDRAAQARGETLGELLQRTALFIFSTTQATNAILEETTARTALLCTQGFPDILVRREGGTLQPYDYSRPFPEPYVARHLTFEIPERVDGDGRIVLPVDELSARKSLRAAARLGVEAVAVCLLWSTANPAHEDLLGALIEQELPGTPYTLSHEINPILREYRRASGTAIDASLKPLMLRHLPAIAAGLAEAGFSGELLAASSAGGAVPLDELVKRPLWSVRSGPSLAPIAARALAEVELSTGQLIVCDAGGTSFDVSLVRDGELAFTRETWLGEPHRGHLTGLSAVDVRSIGAGGGSIAWVDPGGLLRIGPESAGADPGPACYGRGGTRPTVTDAALVLGYLDPELFLGGRMELSSNAAELAVGSLADSLGVDLLSAAGSVLKVANEHMISAIQEITINEGVDPRGSLLVAGGGAAGLTIVPIAKELGCQRVLIPRAAGVLSAYGGQRSDVVLEATVPFVTDSMSFDRNGVAGALDTLGVRLDAFVEQMPAGIFEEHRKSYYVEARYAHQVWELLIPLPPGGFSSPEWLELLVERFHEAHERVFAVKEPGQRIEMTHWKGRLVGVTSKAPLSVSSSGLSSDSLATRTRRAHFSETGTVEIPVHDGRGLGPGSALSGPALIIEPNTTIVVYPGATVSVTSLGNYLVEVA
jgi:N-methylhydantoinase A